MKVTAFRSRKKKKEENRRFIMAIRNWKDIPLFKDVTEEQWKDWHWQVANRLTTVEDINKVINLTDKEKADIEKVIGGFRVGITPYYASLMDTDDPTDPVRMQAVPSISFAKIGLFYFNTDFKTVIVYNFFAISFRKIGRAHV